jgi:predicted metal-dependent TIM-barrel fold hydrolase
MKRSGFEKMLIDAHWALEDDTDASTNEKALNAIRAYITELLEKQREACAQAVGPNHHCLGCQADHLGDDIDAVIRNIPLVEF